MSVLKFCKTLSTANDLAVGRCYGDVSQTSWTGQSGSSNIGRPYRLYVYIMNCWPIMCSILKSYLGVVQWNHSLAQYGYAVRLYGAYYLHDNDIQAEPLRLLCSTVLITSTSPHHWLDINMQTARNRRLLTRTCIIWWENVCKHAKTLRHAGRGKSRVEILESKNYNLRYIWTRH